MAGAIEQTVQQLTAELSQARSQIIELSQRQDDILRTARMEIQAAETRLQDVINRTSMAASSGGNNDSNRFDVLDFKSVVPTAFHGKREESWKRWSRRFRTYCNARREGFRMALTWAEMQEFEINPSTIGRMGWEQAKAADSKLYDFLLMITWDDALVLVEQYGGMGFEAWRQLNKRYSPSGGQYEMDMMNALMNPTAARTLNDLPAAIDRCESVSE